MLKTTSQEFRELFLTQFTRELINNFMPEVELKTIVKEEEKEKKHEIKLEEISPRRPISPRVVPIRQQRRFKPLISPLRIRESRLPPRLQYLRPVPKETPMDLGKLSDLIKDPKVKSIECNGPQKNIIVNVPNRQTTSITLTKEEIEAITKEFSEISKIPIHQGVYKVAAGKLILLAAVSEIVGTKFIIKKIPLPPPIIPR